MSFSSRSTDALLLFTCLSLAQAACSSETNDGFPDNEGGATSTGTTTSTGATTATSTSSQSAGSGGEGGGTGGDVGVGTGGAGGSGGAGAGGGEAAARESCEGLNATIEALASELGCTDPDVFDCPRTASAAAEEGCSDLAVAFFDCLSVAYETATGCECTSNGEDVRCDPPADTCEEEGEALLGEAGCLPSET